MQQPSEQETSHLEEFAEVELEIHEGNLLEKIWVKPTATISYILEECPEKYLLFIYPLAGIVNSLDRAATRSSGENVDILSIILAAVIGGALLGWLSFFIYGFFLSLTGRWIGGYAEPYQFRIVLAWASIPSIATLALIIPGILIFGEQLFVDDYFPTEYWKIAIYAIIFLGELVLGVWAIVIAVKGVALIQSFSPIKAILNLILPVLILIVPLILIFALNDFF